MREETDVDVLEKSVANEPGLRSHELLGDAGPEQQRPRQLVAFHDLLHRQRRHDVERDAGVVPFTMSGRSRNHRVLVGHAGFLRRLRNPVDVGAKGDHRLARSPRGHPCGRNVGDAALHGEAVLLENRGQVLRRLELLKPELAEAEDGVHHLLRELRHRLDARGRFGLVRVQLLFLWRRLRGRLFSLGQSGCGQQRHRRGECKGDYGFHGILLRRDVITLPPAHFHPDVIDRGRIQLLRDVRDLPHVHTVVVAHMQQDLQERRLFPGALGGVHHP